MRQTIILYADSFLCVTNLHKQQKIKEKSVGKASCWSFIRISRMKRARENRERSNIKDIYIPNVYICVAVRFSNPWVKKKKEIDRISIAYLPVL